MDKPVVSISKGADAEKLVEEALNHLGGVESLIRKNSTVIIKPNAGHPCTPESGVNTSPELVSAVIKVLRKAKPRAIIMAEAAAIGCDTIECFEVAGHTKAAEEAGIDDIIDIKREKDMIRLPIRNATSDLKSVEMPKFLIEAEHLVNIPIFKSHVSMMFTCVLKNMKGVVQDKAHYQMHQTKLAESVIDLWTVMRSDLQIADLIRPAEGFGPHAPMPIDFGCVVAGKDPVSVDATVCRMVGLDVDRIPYFESARRRGLGEYDEKMIEVRGEAIKNVYKKLWLPYMEGFGAWPEYNFYLEGACSSCQGLLAFTMEKLKSLGEYDKNKGINIIAGPKKKLPDGVEPGKHNIYIGDCTRRFRENGVFAVGCPPIEPFPLWTIVDRKDYDEMIEIRERMGREEKDFEDHMQKLKQNRDQQV